MNDSLRPAYAYTDRGTIHYAEAGSGTPLLLLHATPGSFRAFEALIPLLARHHRVIAPDTPGYGNSQPVAQPGPLIDAIADSIASLLDALGLERAHMLGLHTGNKIAAALAARRPGRVDRIVLAGHTHSLLVDKAARDSAIRHLIGHYFPGFAPAADGSHEVRRWLMAHADVQKLWWPADLLAGHPAADAASVAAAVVEAESMVIDHLLGWRSIVPTYEAIFDFDLEAALRRIRAPALVLELRPADEADLPAQAPVICAMVPGSTARSLEGCDAGVFRRDPHRVAEAVLPFLASAAPG
jgi:pimeloyl-ACP methyl ester carboxylesterase